MTPTNNHRSGRRTSIGLGALGSLLAAAFLAGIIAAQGMTGQVDGLAGLPASGVGLLLHLLLAAALGAGFGAFVRYQPDAYAATISYGLLAGLLWWILIPLTLWPLVDGTGPSWTANDVGAAFPTLVGFLFWGGLSGLAFHVLAATQRRWLPAPAVDAPRQEPKRIVVLGGGYAGMAVAQRLERKFTHHPNMEVTLVSQSNFLLHTPMLSEVASGEVQAQHISPPLRAICPETRIVHATVEAADLDQQIVQVRAQSADHATTLPYDHLVLALGSAATFYNLPGLEENALTLKSLGDAIRIRNHVIRRLEQADIEDDPEERRRQLTFVVAGAGFAGTETLAALFDMAHSVLRYYPNIPRDEFRLVMVHSRDRILPELSESLASYAQAKLEARGVEFMLGVRVAGATPDSVLLQDLPPLPTRTLIWTAGSQPNPLLRTLGLELDKGGRVRVESTLQASGRANVWAVGDCAAVPDPDAPGQTYPPTAQHALREGKVLGDNIVAALEGQPLKPFRFQIIGLLASLGHLTAVAEVRGYRFSGLLAWLMWRGIYWSKLPGMEKKLRVLLDWITEFFFPRDIVVTD